MFKDILDKIAYGGGLLFGVIVMVTFVVFIILILQSGDKKRQEYLNHEFKKEFDPRYDYEQQGFWDENKYFG